MDSSQEMGTNDVFLWLAAGNKEPKDAIKTASFLSCLLYVETTLGHRFLCLVKVQWLNKGKKTFLWNWSDRRTQLGFRFVWQK